MQFKTHHHMHHLTILKYDVFFCMYTMRVMILNFQDVLTHSKLWFMTPNES